MNEHSGSDVAGTCAQPAEEEGWKEDEEAMKSRDMDRVKGREGQG